LTFCVDNEKKFAKELLEKYLDESSLESAAEKDTLKHLIDLEILAERFKQRLKVDYDKENPTIPLSMVGELREVEKQILDLKEKLGLMNKEEKNTLDQWNILRKKAITYYKQNSGCNIAKCPYCKKLFMIMKDMRGHTTEKLTLFKRTILYNKEMYRWYDEKKITREELAEAFGVHPMYIDLIYENIYKNDR